MPLIAAFHDRTLTRARRARLPLQPAFTDELYRWEHDYFLTHFLRPLPGCTPTLERIVRKELTTVSNHLLNEPLVLVHRDLQSTNILFATDGPALIDYQGMRAGAAAYDLASFLADPYVDLPANDQQALLTSYVSAGGAPEALDAFTPACVQRLAQALGAYGKLGRTPGTERFAAFVPPALRQILRATAVCGTLPVLTKFLSDLPGDAFTASEGHVRLP